MQRRIVFIVNAIFKCLPNLTVPASFLLVTMKLRVYTAVVLHDARIFFFYYYFFFKKALFARYVPACNEQKRQKKRCVFALVALLDVKREGHTHCPPKQAYISALFFLSGVDCHVCVCVCVCRHWHFRIS